MVVGVGHSSCCCCVIYAVLSIVIGEAVGVVGWHVAVNAAGEIVGAVG